MKIKKNYLGFFVLSAVLLLLPLEWYRPEIPIEWMSPLLSDSTELFFDKTVKYVFRGLEVMCYDYGHIGLLYLSCLMIQFLSADNPKHRVIAALENMIMMIVLAMFPFYMYGMYVNTFYKAYGPGFYLVMALLLITALLNMREFFIHMSGISRDN